MTRHCAITDVAGRPITEGVSEYEIEAVAQSVANRRGERVEYNFSDRPDVWFVVKPEAAK